MTDKENDEGNQGNENEESKTKGLQILRKIDQNKVRTAFGQIPGVVPEILVCVSQLG